MSIIEQIATYLAAQGLGTLGETIFYGYLPDLQGASSCILVRDTGGPAPDPHTPQKQHTFQIFIRAADYDTGWDLLQTVISKLHQKIGVTLNETYFQSILATSNGGNIGRNEAGQEEFSINFIAKTRQ